MNVLARLIAALDALEVGDVGLAAQILADLIDELYVEQEREAA